MDASKSTIAHGRDGAIVVAATAGCRLHDRYGRKYSLLAPHDLATRLWSSIDGRPGNCQDRRSSVDRVQDLTTDSCQDCIRNRGNRHTKHLDGPRGSNFRVRKRRR